MSECEREIVADGESTENGRFWCAPDVLAHPLTTAANNGQAEVVAHLCSLAPISFGRLLTCALRALLFGHTDVDNVLVAYMGSGGLTMDDERIVTEMTRVRRIVPGASVDYQEEIIRAVLNQQADVVSALLDSGYVTGQVVSGTGRVAHQDYVAGIDCALHPGCRQRLSPGSAAGMESLEKVWNLFFQFPDLEKVWKFVKSFGNFKKRFGTFLPST